MIVCVHFVEFRKFITGRLDNLLQEIVSSVRINLYIPKFVELFLYNFFIFLFSTLCNKLI